ncbi:rCG31004 [Rattus norvegicus]|uniref:RCG31004 n=1 Tax=Rattus norvegicus TaxID=10116 RepID=A6ITC9_RAT|nr:rCG31004 [Rattus norvegicus]
MESRASCMLGKCCARELHTPFLRQKLKYPRVTSNCVSKDNFKLRILLPLRLEFRVYDYWA